MKKEQGLMTENYSVIEQARAGIAEYLHDPASVSVSCAAHSIDDLIFRIRTNNPYAPAFQFYEMVADAIPQKIPIPAQQKALEAAQNPDKALRRQGRDLVLFLNLKSIISAVKSCKTESSEERDEMIQSAFVSVSNRLADIRSNQYIPQRVYNAAEYGATSYIGIRSNFPIEWIRSNGVSYQVLEKIKAAFGGKSFRPTWSDVDALAKELSGETKISEDTLRNYILYLYSIENQEEAIEEDAQGSTIGLSEKMAQIINRLNPREQAILKLRFFEGMTLEDVAREFELTRERIRQIEDKALKKLRFFARRENLAEYIDAEDEQGKLLSKWFPLSQKKKDQDEFLDS